MAGMKILLIEDKRSEVLRYQEYFATREDTQLVGTTGSSTEGLLLVQKFLPDAVILDIELEEGSGLHFLSGLDSLELPVRPYILVTTWTSEHRTLLGLKSKGVGYVQIKSKPGYSERGPQMVFDILKEIEPFFGCDEEGAQTMRQYHAPASLEELKREKISEALGRIKINRGNAPQAYLVEAIYLASEHLAHGGIDIDMDNIIYPQMHKKFKQSPAAMEKSMRLKIEYVWLHVEQKVLLREYTQYVDPEKAKPVLRDFIGYYADKFK